MFEDMDRLVERMHELGNNRKLVRIGIPPMTGATIFPPILIAFQKQYPDVRVVVQEHGALRCRELVESDELDLAIAITNGVDPGQFNSIGIVDTRILFCVSASHPLASRERVTPEECCREPLVMMPAGSYVRQVVEQMFRARNLKASVLLHSSQILTMMNLIREQAAAAFMIENLIRRTPGLVGIPTNPPLDMLHIGLIWKRNKTLYSDVTRFIRFARSYTDNLRR